MVRTLTLGHRGPAGDLPLDRVRAAGYLRGARSFATAENLAWESLDRSTPAGILAAWIASAVHRGHLLDPRFRDTAIAVALAPPTPLTNSRPGAPITEVFAVRH